MIMVFSFLPYCINITLIPITFHYILIFQTTTHGVKETLGRGKLVLEGNRKLVLQYNYPVQRHGGIYDLSSYGKLQNFQ